MNFRYTTAAFTLSPESRASLCRANLPGDWALYAVSVRRLIALRSDFLQTVPRGSALVFVNGVRVPRKSQVKISSFFEAKLPLLPLERHFFEISIKPT